MYIDLCEALEDEQIMLDQAYLDEIEIQKEKIQMKIKTQQRLAVEAAGRLERKKTRADNKAKRLIQKQERKDFWAREAAVLAEIKKVHYGLDCDVADRPEQVRYNLQDFIFTICIWIFVFIPVRRVAGSRKWFVSVRRRVRLHMIIGGTVVAPYVLARWLCVML